MLFALLSFCSSFTPNVAFSRGAGWRGLCPAQTVTDRTVGYNAWLCRLCFEDVVNDHGSYSHLPMPAAQEEQIDKDCAI
jgi:hypothetical protein